MSTRLKYNSRSPFLAINAHRREELVATDTMYSGFPNIASGATQAKFYGDQEYLVCDVVKIKTDKQCVNTLEDNICQLVVIDKLLSDIAQVEIIGCVKDIIHAYFIGNWSSESHQQQQKYYWKKGSTCQTYHQPHDGTYWFTS